VRREDNGFKLSQSHLLQEGLSTSPTTVKPFTFGELKLTDDNAFLATSATADIGEIQLKIWRVVSLGKGKHVAPLVEQKVHERAKKATSHRVILGDDVQRPSRKTYQTKILDKEPLVTFVFKYRPLCIHALFCL